MKISKRLQTIASLVDTKSIIDVGCDHALLDIYLTQKNIKCIATDINENVLKKSKENIKKYNLEKEIKLIQTNGLIGIKIKKQDTIIISGMGTSTILNILNNVHLNNKLIICSNNELEKLRKNICKKNYIIVEEQAIYEKKHWYVIIKFEKGFNKYNKIDYIIGPKAKYNKKYLKYLKDKYTKINKNIPNKYIIKKIKVFILIQKIKKLLNSF